jgi:hypothetical protein
MATGERLAEDILLGDDFLRQLMSVGEVDVLVGIPSRDNGGTIGAVAQAIEECIRQSFVRERVVILNADGGSTDNTREVLLEHNARRSVGGKGLTSLRTVHRVTVRYGETPSAGMAVRTILSAADLLRAKSCAIIPAANASSSPVSIANLLRPVDREHCDYVTPLYSRTKYQGLLARNLLYPMTRAVFGRRIREMYSDEWAFSGRLAAQCLEENVWHEEAVNARPEAWMGVLSICSKLNCAQTFVGPRIPPPAGSSPDIVEAIRQTVGNLFWCMEKRQSEWMDFVGSEPVATFGPDHEVVADENVPANPEKIFELFRSGVNDLEPILKSILTDDTHGEIKRIAGLDADSFRFPNEIWVRTLYEFAAAYHHTIINRDHLVQALVPFYRGNLYSFLLEHIESTSEVLESESESLCLEFERQKMYLVERWKVKTEVTS